MSSTCSTILTASIGIIGTAIGSVIGFILGKLRFGRLLFDFKIEEKLEDCFEYSSNWHDSKKPRKLKELKVKMSVRIYNSSEKNDVISDCTIAFINKKKTLCSEGIIDQTTVKHSNTISYGSKYGTLNIPPKYAVNIPVELSFSANKKILESTRMAFTYRNKKFKQKRRTICKIDFSDVPEFYEEDKHDA